jgi:hypothetical protein
MTRQMLTVGSESMGAAVRHPCACQESASSTHQWPPATLHYELAYASIAVFRQPEICRSQDAGHVGYVEIQHLSGALLTSPAPVVRCAALR